MEDTGEVKAFTYILQMNIHELYTLSFKNLIYIENFIKHYQYE